MCPRNYSGIYESTLTGLWESAPCREEIERYPAHEMMTVLSGLVSLTDADGHTETFATGDTFSLRKVQSAPEWEIHGIPKSGAGEGI
jgi:uncharacterized cupin superfamily protein